MDPRQRHEEDGMLAGKARGFTLMELVTAMAVSLVLTTLVVQALVGLAKDRASREMVIDVQGNARLALSMIEQDLRIASLGSGTGIIWVNSAGTRQQRTAVQIYDNVAGGGFLVDPARGGMGVPPKPNTDALLVVQALTSPRTMSKGDQFNSTGGLTVADVKDFSIGNYVLFGDYGDAAWDQVTNVSAGSLTLASTVDLFPVRGVQLPGATAAGKLSSGSMVRAARARLYYVDSSDELVRLTLAQPGPPADPTGVLGLEVIATGVENLQVDCQMEASGDLGACAGATADPAAAAALGPAASRITAANVSTLRTVSVGVVFRGRTPLREQHGDQPISLQSQTLLPAGYTAADEFVRRTYQLQVAVRNTSLGVL
jgi:prepilin-type N-terminal cleavage/methylation domain-containing protein